MDIPNNISARIILERLVMHVSPEEMEERYSSLFVAELVEAVREERRLQRDFELFARD